MQAHEYSVVGHNRTLLGRWLFTGASVLAAVFTALGVIAAEVAKSWGLPEGVRTYLIAPVGAAAVFALLHLTFAKWGWRAFCLLGLFPRVVGRWSCEGSTIDDDGNVTYRWQANVTITQDWEKIRVHLKTAQSGSYSVAASLLPEGDGGWMLMYSYRNEPRQGEPELKSHIGYCELHFAPDGKTAEGDYFNARGRKTAGRMKLTKEI